MVEAQSSKTVDLIFSLTNRKGNLFLAFADGDVNSNNSIRRVYWRENNCKPLPRTTPSTSLHTYTRLGPEAAHYHISSQHREYKAGRRKTSALLIQRIGTWTSDASRVKEKRFNSPSCSGLYFSTPRDGKRMGDKLFFLFRQRARVDRESLQSVEKN